MFIDMDTIVDIIAPKIDIDAYYLKPEMCFREIEDSRLRQFLLAYFHIPGNGDNWLKEEHNYFRELRDKYILFFSYSAVQKTLNNDGYHISDSKRVLESYWRRSRGHCWPIFFVYDIDAFNYGEFTPKPFVFPIYNKCSAL